MYKRLNQLSFVIGLFFTVMGIILVANSFFTEQHGRMSMYTASVFLVFGLLMMFAKSGSQPAD